MSEDPVTFVRAEDLLDDAPPKRLARGFGLSRRRQAYGLGLALVLLPTVTLAMDLLSAELDLDAQVLVFLLAVVFVAFVGGVLVAVGSAICSALLINYFFVEPIHTFTVGDADQVVALLVFVLVAILVSGAIELAARRAEAVERARLEAEAISSVAGPDLGRAGSLEEVLKRARETFGMESVSLLSKAADGSWEDVGHAGWAPRGSEAPLRFDVPASPRLRLVGRGPARFAEDQRVLEAFAAAARTAYEGRVLTGEAESAKTLAEADRQRTALLAAVGHDLRTPLAAIKAAATTLRQTDIAWSGEERDALLETIEGSTDRLEGVVANLLDASRLQAGALAVRPGPVALDEVVAGALLALPAEPSAVEVHVPDDLHLVTADRGLLQRVLVNLIDNALRHGGDRPVEVRAHIGGESAKLEVIDHGRGATEEEHARMFEPFQQLGDRGGENAGVGLGLAVAKGFVEAMNGAMMADTTPGGGLTMRVRLPLAPGKDEAPE